MNEGRTRDPFVSPRRMKNWRSGAPEMSQRRGHCRKVQRRAVVVANRRGLERPRCMVLVLVAIDRRGSLGINLVLVDQGI